MAKPQTLLEKALAIKAREAPGLALSDDAREEIDLYVAWVSGELDTSDVRLVTGGRHNGAIATRAGTVIRNGVRGGYIEIIKKVINA